MELLRIRMSYVVAREICVIFKAHAARTYIGTLPILRQQRDWVDGVRLMTNFADEEYFLC